MSRSAHLKSFFGLTLEDFCRLFENQEGLCAICSCLMKRGGVGRDANTAVVDHCHATGTIRGLLCRKCNSGIGFLRDDLRIVKNAATYLQEHV